LPASINSLILTPPEVVTVNSLLTGKTTASYLNLMFERLGIAQLILLSTAASIGHLVQKLLDCRAEVLRMFVISVRRYGHNSG
jgi:hypothetical protein